MFVQIFRPILFLFAFFSCEDAKPNPGINTFPKLKIVNAFPNLSFTRPLDIQHVGDNQLFVVEQQGRIIVFENDPNVKTSTVFLDITSVVDDRSNEEGLLGLSFHPNYKSNGFFYVNYTRDDSKTVIARYSVSSSNPNQADPNSELVLLTFDQPYGNHNGGDIEFGPDGYLYIAVGDGGSGGDPQGHGQNRETLLGNILRIDVDQPVDGKNYGIPTDNPFATHNVYRKEIFAWGMRNPWRMSFDSQTGLLWAGDVGQNKFEEIDIIENGKNYGWNIMEGFQKYRDGDQSSLTLPIHEYGRRDGGSVTGGVVYRGNKLPSINGAYIYADFVSGRIWKLTRDSSGKVTNTELFDTNYLIASFGVDPNQNLYFASFDGKIYKFEE